MPVVYQATNTVNGKRYIGVTRKTLDYRRARHLELARRNGRECPRLYDAVRKYGHESFEWVILAEVADFENALRLEFEFVRDQFPEYNVVDGGRAAPISAGVNKKPVICLNDGMIYPSVGLAAKAYSVTISCISSSCSGKSKSAAEGRQFAFHVRSLTEIERNKIIAERRAKTIAARKWGARDPAWVAVQIDRITNGKGVNPKNSSHVIEGGRDVLGRSAAGPMSKSRNVICLDDGKIFPSISAAARNYDVAKSALTELCLGKRGRKTVGGFRFAYAEAA